MKVSEATRFAMKCHCGWHVKRQTLIVTFTWLHCSVEIIFVDEHETAALKF